MDIVVDHSATITLFLCGDVMTGRGIDQILAHPGNPSLFEPYVGSATEYVRLAEDRNGPISRPADPSHIWGDARGEFDRIVPDLRVINLETSVTTSSDYDQAKQVHYRMHPANVSCLTAAGIQCCTLANNHVLDWGRAGLIETLKTLTDARLASAGAGRNLEEATRPAMFDVPGKGRVLVFACGCESAGVPPHWAATPDRPGIWLMDEQAPDSVDRLAAAVHQVKRPADIVILSIHWGGNWGHEVPLAQREFAHNAIDRAGIDVVHGHSSHHVKGLEVYRDRLILYGCGDLITDYEGIAGYEDFRGDLGLMYFVTVDPASGKIANLEMTPTQLKRFRLTRASATDAAWLAGILNREGRARGTFVKLTQHNQLALCRRGKVNCL